MADEQGSMEATQAVADAPDPGPKKSTRGLGVAAFIVLLALQAALLVVVIRTNNEVADLRDQIEATSAPTGLGNGLSSPGPASAGPDLGTTVAPVTGNLPRFLGGGADAALGRNIGDISGLDYYTGQITQLAAADGKSRAYMIWAHWCPYCQEELPVLADWQTTSAAEFANFELVSVTTSIDDTASNPLIPYLDSNDFPFPVLVDEDGSLARKFGVNAFPFWVFVAPDGTVVGRAAGAIDAGNLESVFSQLNDLPSDGPAALSARG